MNEQKTSGRGRKAAGASNPNAYQLRRVVYLDDESADTMRRLGKGNISAGIRQAAAVFKNMRK